jgi:hypothetical protein
MVRSDETVYDLRRMFTNTTNHSRVSKVRPRVPGSLGQDMQDPHSSEWVFGSLMMSVTEYSVFVFRNGKIKISGGSKGWYSAEKNYEQWLETIVAAVMEVLHELNETQQPTKYTWSLCLLNGSMTIGRVLLSDYKTLCENVCRRVQRGHPFFVSATMPVCYQPNGWLKRGRVCSIAVKFPVSSDNNKKTATARFDHGGRVQFFAVRSMEDLNRAGVELRALLLDIK